MALLDDESKSHLKHMMADLKDEVTIKLFTQEKECRFCEETLQLVNEISEVSDKIKVETYDFAKDKEIVAWYGIERVPAIVVEGDEDNGVRFYGIPAGHELNSLIAVIKLVSTGDSPLKPDTVDALANLANPVHIKVFVTLTCPNCPPAVHIAHQMALASPNVKAEMIESAEFPELAEKYGVYEVPKVIINDQVEFVGAIPEKAFLKFVKKAAEMESGKKTGQA